MTCLDCSHQLNEIMRISSNVYEKPSECVIDPRTVELHTNSIASYVFPGLFFLFPFDINFIRSKIVAKLCLFSHSFFRVLIHRMPAGSGAQDSISSMRARIPVGKLERATRRRATYTIAS